MIRHCAEVTRAASRMVALGLLMLVAHATARAENLVSIHNGTLPSIESETPVSHVLAVDGRLVALAGDAAYVLDESRNAWTRVSWQPRGPVGAVAGNGQQAFLLMSASGGGIETVEKLTLTANALESQPLPPLPSPLLSAQGAVLGDTFYVAGTRTDGTLQLFAINLQTPANAWTAQPSWAGHAGEVTSLAAQSSALFATLENPSESPTQGPARLLQWKADEGWTEKAAAPGRVVADTARAIGQAHVLYLMREGESRSKLRLVSFHTITGSWATLEELDAEGTRAGAAWKNGILWLSPAAGDNATRLAFAELEKTELPMDVLDWAVIVIYLAAMIGMGFYFYVRDKRTSTAEFFVGSRTIPFWAAGVSLYAANTSSISYIAIPAKSFETNWQYLTNNLIAVLGLMFVAVWIVPVLRRLDLMSVFQYLETRFHPLIRSLASALCIAVQIGSRMSVILFLPSLAISTIMGIDVAWSILAMGVFTMIYTAMGGMKAVIWTDFVQLIVKMGGILFAIGFVVYMLHGGVGELLTTAAAENKMKLFDFSWDLTKATVWGFIFLVFFEVVLTFPKDQVLMQRVLSTRTAKDAGKSIWMMAAIMIPGGFLFYMVGTALYVFYKANPDRLNPLLPIDATFPLFIAAELPMGVRGLIIAGILAAAMATLSSIMNSVATLASVDFYEKLVKNPNPKVSVRFAEAMTVVTGIAGMSLALLLSRYDIRSLFDVSIELGGLLGGGFAGAYTLGMFTRRANWQGVAIGVVASIVLTTLAWTRGLVHPYFYLPISIMICIVVGYAASWFFPAPRLLAGLTIYEDKPTSETVPAPS